MTEQSHPKVAPSSPSGRSRQQDFESRLRAYATAAAAAGVGLLATSVPANAEVVFTPAKVTFNSGVVYIDLNNDGTNDFALSIYNFLPADRRFAASGLRLNDVLGYIGSSYPPLAAKAGYRIGGQPSFFNREAPAVNVAATFGSYIGGPFANRGLRFFGLRFKINGEVHFGWAAVVAKARAHRHSPSIEVTLLGYAYETEAHKAILAGDTGSGEKIKLSDPVPEAGTLGRLALGWQSSEE